MQVRSPHQRLHSGQAFARLEPRALTPDRPRLAPWWEGDSRNVGCRPAFFASGIAPLRDSRPGHPSYARCCITALHEWKHSA